MRCCHPLNPRHRGWRIAGHILLAALLGLVLAGGFGLAVQYLWNHVLRALFPVPWVGYWQAVGLLLLTRLLFGGFGRRHGRGGHGRHPGCGHDWRRRLRRTGLDAGPDPSPQAPATE